MPQSRRASLTVEQIKKNAKILRRSNPSLRHGEALRLAAQELGYPDFFAAQRAIARVSEADPTPALLDYLTIEDLKQVVNLENAFVHELQQLRAEYNHRRVDTYVASRRSYLLELRD